MEVQTSPPLRLLVREPFLHPSIQEAGKSWRTMGISLGKMHLEGDAMAQGAQMHFLRQLLGTWQFQSAIMQASEWPVWPKYPTEYSCPTARFWCCDCPLQCWNWFLRAEMCPTRMLLLSVALVSNSPVYGFSGRLWLDMKMCYYSKALKGGDWSKVLSARRFSGGGSTSSKRSAWDGWPVGSMGIFIARCCRAWNVLH